MIFDYKGTKYPEYLKHGNACRFIAPAAEHFCKGRGLDVGAGKWPLPGATPIDLSNGGNAMELPKEQFDYVFSSHCLEHLKNPVAALEHWKLRIRPGGVLFLYLPHPEMEYWLPQNNRKHLHAWQPREMARIMRDLGFVNVIHTEGWDAAWSFMVVGFTPDNKLPEPDQAFRWLATESSDHVHIDPQLASVFKKYGADAFRRSSAVEAEFETLIKRGNFGGKRCVEIGTYNGMTAIVLSRYFKEVVSFDVFPHTIKHTIVNDLGITNIRFFDVKNNTEKAEIIRGLDFDGAYVDGNHDLDTETDFALVERCGQVLFHEYWQTQMPVWNLVNRLRQSGHVETEGKFALWRPSKA